MRSGFGRGRYARPCYLAPAKASIYKQHYPNLGKWIVQPESEAIEISGADFNGKVLLIVHLYYQRDTLLDMQFVPGREEFLAWVDQ